MQPSVEELQNSIIEWQAHIIGELMRLYATGQDFNIPPELAEIIQQVKEMRIELSKP